MSDVGDIYSATAPHPLIAATIAQAPASLDAPAYVYLDAFDGSTQTFGPCDWPNMHGQRLPAVGAHCLVAFDDNGVPWIVSWEGAAYFPAPSASMAFATMAKFGL